MSWELFQKAYLAADEQIKALIDSDSIANAIDLLIAEGLITEATTQTLLRLYPLVLLNVHTPEQFITQLQNQNISNGIAILQKLQEHIKQTPPSVSTHSAPDATPASEATTHLVPPVQPSANTTSTHPKPIANTSEATDNQAVKNPPTDDSPGAIHYPAQSETSTPTNLPTENTPAEHLDTPSTPPTQNTTKEEPVYTTTQEAILRERAPQLIPEQNNPQPPPKPPTLKEQSAHQTNKSAIRWGSDT